MEKTTFAYIFLGVRLQRRKLDYLIAYFKALLLFLFSSKLNAAFFKNQRSK